MSLPAYWFGPPPALVDDERWIAHVPGNRSQGKRAVGGGLHVTSKRLLFTPNIVDAKLGGKAWYCALADVESVGIEPGRISLFELFSGGLRDRLAIQLRDGSRELFVVDQPAVLVDQLRALVTAR